jgi:hypothetical protein
VKIGCYRYVVKEVKSVNKFEPRKGEIDYYEKVIRLDEDMSTDDKLETLLHEIVHGIDDFMDVGLEEDQVKKLGHGLAMVFMDNPDLKITD